MPRDNFPGEQGHNVSAPKVWGVPFPKKKLFMADGETSFLGKLIGGFFYIGD